MMSELEYNIEETELVLEHTKNRIIVTKAILAGVNLLGSFRENNPNISKPNIESFNNPNGTLSELNTFDGSQSTYNGLVNSGEFYQIKKQSIAYKMQIYYERINSGIFKRELEITRNYRIILNSKHRLGIGTYTTLSLSELIKIAKTDKQFGAELEHLYSMDHWQYNYISKLQYDAKSLKQEIEQRNN